MDRRASFLSDLPILFLFSFFFLFRLGAGSLASWDEALYASVSHDIVRSGEWLRLTLGGELWCDKPPLTFWATAFFYRLFGVSEFSARLFSALCGAGTVIVTYLFGRRLIGPWPAFLGAAALASSAHFLRAARFGMLDAPLTFFLSLSFYLFWRGREDNSRFLVWSGISLGLAFFTKGFAAFLFFPVILLYVAWSREWGILRSKAWWAGLFGGALIAAPWYVAQVIREGGPFLYGGITKHLFERTTQALDGHAGNAYFYIRTFINKYRPWMVIGIFSAPYFLIRAWRKKEPAVVFVSCWILAVFLVITAVQTKLRWYILPLYPAVSLTVGWALSKVLKEKHRLLAVAMFTAVFAVHGFYSHLFTADYSRTIKGLAPAVEKTVPPGKTVYLYNYHESPAVYFYMNRKNAYLDNREAWTAVAQKNKTFFCLIHQPDLEILRDIPGISIQTHAVFEDLVLVQAGV